MTVFYIDTTSRELYTGIVQNNQLLIERKECLSNNLSTFTVDEVAKMFDEVNLAPKDIELDNSIIKAKNIDILLSKSLEKVKNAVYSSVFSSSDIFLSSLFFISGLLSIILGFSFSKHFS